jgi:hypothetical protein
MESLVFKDYITAAAWLSALVPTVKWMINGVKTDLKQKIYEVESKISEKIHEVNIDVAILKTDNVSIKSLLMQILAGQKKNEKSLN